MEEVSSTMQETASFFFFKYDALTLALILKTVKYTTMLN